MSGNWLDLFEDSLSDFSGSVAAVMPLSVSAPWPYTGWVPITITYVDPAFCNL